MRMDQFTVKAQEGLGSAQTLAEKSDHPEVTPEHLLRALLDQEGGVVPSILGMSIMQVGIFAAIPLVADREKLILKRLSATPLRRWQLVAPYCSRQNGKWLASWSRR